jgi:signal transduction histidine kinase/CheY-like chemotaxis protein
MKLATRYFTAFAALATSACVTIAIVDAVGQYRENVAHVGELQRAEARAVATRIASYLETLAMQLHDVDALPWASGILDDNDRRSELQRLLKLNPAIYELRFVTPAGRERTFVSRVGRDRVSQRAWPLAERYPRGRYLPLWYGPVYFREGSVPYVSLAVRSSDQSDLLVAEVNLRYVTDVIALSRIGQDGRAYVIDGTDHLIAHPDLSFVHRKVSLADVPQVASARAHDWQLPATDFTQVARSPDAGLDVLTSATLVAAPQWLVFVEQPLHEVMAPVRASIYRVAAILAVFLVVGILCSRYLAVRLTRPIVELERGASRIASGDLSVRVSAGRNDEIQSLASEFNRMAENLGRSYSGLEAKVQRRTQELADAAARVRAQADEVASLNAQLQLRLGELAARKDDAERANAAKTRFLAAASHDLRQPMQAISLLVEVLRGRITDRDAGSLVDKVQASVQALESLFVSLLDISRLDAGAIRPNLQEFRIASLLGLIEANFLPQALAKGIKLDVVNSTAVVRSDPALLERVLSNLVSNAVRYTSRGRVLVGCRRRGARLRILVFDTGPGVPGRFHQDIFEEFFQLANPERDRTKGLGLGLSIVKRTAEILDHPLILRSEVNRGSVFGIDVPLLATHSVPAVRTRFASPDPSRFAGTFVLVIDDDKDSRFAIEALCIQWGCHVVGAGSAEAALQKLQEHLRSPDLIISDFRLQGGETGITAIEMIRHRTEDSIPAIVVTGDTSVVNLGLTRQSRIALMFKPINAEKLWAAADKLLGAPAPHRH